MPQIFWGVYHNFGGIFPIFVAFPRISDFSPLRMFPQNQLLYMGDRPLAPVHQIYHKYYPKNKLRRSHSNDRPIRAIG
ncbi:hypothetical protein [Microcoleus anatoxicus]|uniref:Uncharacterized protein n=1 Tax=Microcoleus anatoxicus PTRS2 TaxID=2705321 RepID=A0ABU8YR67_9CYAN